MKKRSILLWILLAFAGCDEDETIRPRVESLPSQFRMEAVASFTDPSGTTVDCSLDFVFELRSETFRDSSRVIYAGVHGGETFRRILDEDGAGFAFFADAFGEIEAHLDTSTGATTLLAPVNETATNQFWRELARFHASMDQNGNGTGSWTCAPLEIDQNGYVDNTFTIEGTFQIHPIN